MSGQAVGCWHCGEPLVGEAPFRVTLDGVERGVCGAPCRDAAARIGTLGLESYYRYRSAPGPKPGDSSDDAQVWSRPEVARHAVRDLGDGRRETMLLVDGVRCAGCVRVIESALAAERGVVDVQVNAASRRARVAWRDAETTLPKLLAALAQTGYRALPLDAQALDDVRRHEANTALKRLIVAAFGAMQAMMYAGVLYLGDPESLDEVTRDLFRWLGFLVATPVVLYSARPFFAGALRSLKARRAGMDVPVALAIAAIYAASLIEATRGGVHVYFESVSMFVFFLLIGRYVEMRARHRASDLTDALARLSPPHADRRAADGRLERVGVRELVPGDRVHVADGTVVPADGRLESMRCLVDEALLSGESAPVERRRGEALVAGSVLVEGPAEIRVERVGDDTALAGIAELVGRAQAAKPRLAQAGERAASRFVLRVLLLTLATATAWAFVDPTRAFSASLAVLVVSCPCAFALAVPVAITRALAVLARRGVLVVKPDAIEAMAATTHVVFDKTGTLTEPQLAVSRITRRRGVSEDEAWRLAVGLARESRHPAARAIAAARPNTVVEAPKHVAAHAGRGVEGTIGDRALRLGRADFAAGLGVADSSPQGIARDAPPQGAESEGPLQGAESEGPLQGAESEGPLQSADGDVVLADSAGIIAAFTLSERIRADAAGAVSDLKRQGLAVSVASGDAPSRVEAVASALRIDDWSARQLPAEKLARLTTLRERGERVMAVGDGVNDAPVLAGADVAVAIAEGAELAQATSDVVLAGGRLAQLAPARAIATQTLHILKQNQRWALTYNLSAVPLAALGFVPPLLAALGMSVSSLVVVLNAMRIGRRQRDRETPPQPIAAAELPMEPA